MPKGKYKRTEKHRKLSSKNIKKWYASGGGKSRGNTGKKWDPIKDKDRIIALKERMMGNTIRRGSICSKATLIKMSLSKKGTGQKLGFRHNKKTKITMRLTRCNEGNSNWKGGLKKLNQAIRRLVQYKEWRNAVLRRDGWMCINCYDQFQSNDINVHHFNPLINILSKFNIKNVIDAINCPDIWDINNGITLCIKCHKIIHKKINNNNNNNNNNMEGQNEQKIWSTRDIYLAATLVTLKFKVIGIDYQQEGTKNNLVGFFKFEETSTLLDAKSKYNQGLLAIEPRNFVLNFNSLKSEVIGYITNPHVHTK